MKRRNHLLLALILLVAIAGCAAEQATDESQASAAAPIPVTTDSAAAEASYLAGWQANDMGRFTEAHEHMMLAVEADPEFAAGHLGAALTANSLETFSNHLEQAAEHAEGASEAEQAWIESVQKSFDRDYEGQLAAAKRLAELAPEAPRALLQVATAHAALGNYEQQRVTAKRVVQMAPGFVPAYAQLGNSYLFNEPRDFDQAEQYMARIVELMPQEPNAHDLMGDVHRAKGHLEMARAAYTRAADLDPTSGSALQQRGHVNSFLGNYEEARADYQTAMDLSDPDTAANFAIWKALVSVHAGDPVAAIAELEELLIEIDEMGLEGARSHKVNTLFNIWRIASHNGMEEETASAVERLEEVMMAQAEEVGTEEFRRGQEAQLAYFEGMSAAFAGDAEEANAKAEEFMSLVEADTDPNKNRPAHEIMGLAALVQEDYEEAVAHYEQTDPADVYARYHLGLAYEGAGNAEAAQAIFDDVAVHNFNFVGYALVREEAMEKASEA